jgi:Tol biopolymer transport system component/predicted Ser/Thr protein kinase
VSLAPATRLGPYEIVALVGAGGMGEVYRARDTRLSRIVAIKVIHTAYGHRPDIRRRFEEEARLAAQLDHPRIGAVYDVGHDAGVDYFVMEFIEGRTLAGRIAEGRLPFAEMIEYAIEIAAGLAYAHRRGVEHRDLKPGNVLLTPSGVKVIDFGLSKLRQDERRPSDRIAAMETVPLPTTEPGSVPGTAGYLPPERLQGLRADHRSDIFAFGALLYEMAAGRRAFDGATPADLVASVLTADPPPLAGQEPALADVDWVIRRCLRKVPDERWQSMADVEAVLKRIASTASMTRLVEERAAIRRWPRLLAAGMVLALALGGLAFLARGRSAPAAPPLRPVAITIPPPPGTEFTPTESSVQSPQLAVSPDGRYIAFVASGADRVSQIWLRPIDSFMARPIPGTLHATYPFWSPSSRSIGFFSDGELKRIDIEGGPARTMAKANDGRGGAWSADDVILFSPSTSDVIYRVSANGGTVPQTVMSVSRREISHRWPQFLPDGRHFIYLARSADDNQSAICLASLDATGGAVVVRSSFGGVYAPPGMLLYVAEGTLLAANFDIADSGVTDDPVPIVDRVATSSSFYGAFSASNNGVLAYATSASVAELAWMGRDGRRLGVAAGAGRYVDFQLSPDGRYVAVAEVEPLSDRPDLRLVDLVRGANLRLTTSPATDASPVWSPDSARLVFRSNRERRHDLYIRPAAGGGEDRPFLKTSEAKYPSDWSPDGSFVVYHAEDERTHHDVWAVPIDHPDQPRTLVQTEFDEMQGRISPSGRWLAYTSNQSSRFEVYIQPLQADGRKWQISIDGGSDPKWRADEKELFYIGLDGRMMSVDVNATAAVDPGTPRPLFPLRDFAAVAPYLSAYDVQRDGQRFLVRLPIEELKTHPLNVLLNWSVPDRATK